MNDASDAHLASASLAGDDDAYALLVSRHKRRVFGLAARFAGDCDEREDICQETFVRAYEHLKSYRHEAPFEHWLVRICVRVCHDLLRKRQQERGVSLDDVAELQDRAGELRQTAGEMRRLLFRAMERLKPDERLVITLLELEEYTVRETAELTGWSEGNVKVRGHRARQTLKRILEEHDAR
jgi:RNA polymerase sigma-70 factor (ECF subfamily)